jgi:hypothetical protein
VKNELERICKELVMMWFKALSQNFPGGSGKLEQISVGIVGC